MTRLFVYGTLRKGCGNHRRLDKSKYVGIRKTAPGFSLLCLNGLPIMVRSAGDSRVTGEMYEVTPTTMKRLDILEGHPDFYTREEIHLEDGTGAQAYLFLTDLTGERDVAEIQSGDWTA